MRFSVIIPIYKVEDYIDECIMSVLSQEFTDYEIILVDDGSPDGCPRLCDEYAEKYPQISVIHRENGGLSEARNTGIKKAAGDYLFFLDGDDVMYEGALKGLSSELEKNGFPDLMTATLVYMRSGVEYTEFDNGKFSEFCKDHTIYELCEAYAIQDRSFPWHASHSVFKRSFINRFGLRFKKNLIGAEDCEFFFRLVPKVTSFAAAGTKTIRYRLNREGSIMTSPSFASIRGELTVFRQVFEFWENIGSEPMMGMIAKVFMNAFLRSGELADEKQRSRCVSYVKKYRKIILYPVKDIKFTIFRAVWRTLGYKNGNKLLVCVKRARKRLIKKSGQR